MRERRGTNGKMQEDVRVGREKARKDFECFCSICITRTLTVVEAFFFHVTALTQPFSNFD